MRIPPTIRAGDTITWRDDAAVDYLGDAVTSSTYSLTYYLRTNTASEGATVTGSAYGTGWQSTISATTSAAFDAGTWYWQAIAASGATKVTLGSGQLTMLAALNYTGTPGALDGRSQAQQDLDAVSAAIRSMISGGGVQKYSIGNRSVEKMSLSDLLTLESRLKAEVARERKAELVANGLGNPHAMFVRFR
jgi:hypothetical protein